MNIYNHMKLAIIIILMGIMIAYSGQDDKDSKIPEPSIKDSINRVLSNIELPNIPRDTINLIEFSGIAPDEEGSYDYAGDINRAIEKLAKKGGGTLLFPHPEGKDKWIKQTRIYTCQGPIYLKSNIRLSMETSTKIQFKFDPQKYLIDGKGVLTRYEGTTLYTYSPCIRGFDVKNVAIVSAGGTGAMPVINGDGESWKKWEQKGVFSQQAAGKTMSYKKLREINNKDVPIRDRRFGNPEKDFLRPPLMQFMFCENILVDGVKLQESPFWVVHSVFSKSMTVRNLIYDAQVVNNDGVDVESSQYVLVENNMFDNHDDNVVMKAGRDQEGIFGALVAGTELESIDFAQQYINNGRITAPTKDVVIRNNVFKGHYAICCGSEMSGGVKNVFALHNYANQDVNRAFYLKGSRKRGGIVENVIIKDMEVNRAGDAIVMSPNYDHDTTSQYPPVFKNIHIEDMTVNKVTDGIVIFGWSDRPLKNIYLKNINIKQATGTDFQYMNVNNLNLQNVKVNGKILDGHYSEVREDKLAPFKK